MSGGGPGRRPRGLPAALAVAVLALPAAAAPARGALRPALPTIVQDDATLLHGSDAAVAAAVDRLAALHVDELRITARWSELAPERDPAGVAPDDDARFAALDRAVRLADARGLAVALDVGFSAPRWATSDPPGTDRPRTDVDPRAFAGFAARVARRYDGTRPGLPRVGTFSLWNEPNHPAFLAPQWRRSGGRLVPASPARYAAMVRAAYPAIKAVDPRARVLVGGTSSEGSYSSRGCGPVPPLRFLRALACVDRALRPVRDGDCADFTRLPGDGWSEHPYSLRSVPGAPAPADRPDDVPIGSIGRLTATLRRLVDAGRLAPRLADVYVTEYGYESNPPSALRDWSLDDQARFLPWSEYLAWRDPAVKSFAQFLLRDTPPALRRVSPSARRPYGEWGSGLLFADGTPKPAARALAAGLYVRRARAGHVVVWGHLRAGTGVRRARLELRSRPGAPWRAAASRPVDGTVAVATFSVSAGGILERVARAPRGAAVRLAYGAGLDRAGPPAPAVGATPGARR